MTKAHTRPKVLASENERFMAALSYVWILCLYTLLFKRNSTFIRFHAKQGLALFVLEVLSPIFLFLAIPVIIVCVIASIVGVAASLSGKYWTLPLIGNWLKKSSF
jgi:fumarate reductase subunit D